MSKNAEREPFSVSLISGIEKKMDERVGGEAGVSRLSVELFLSPSAKKFRRVALLCCVSENI